MTNDAPGKPRRWIWWVGGVVVVIALIVAIAVAVGGSTTSPTPSGSPSVSPTPDVSPTSAAPEPSASDSSSTQPEDVTVPLDSQATVQEGLSVRVTTLEAVEGEPLGPGEVGGPALRVTVEFRNATDTDLDLGGAVVNLSYGADRTPANPVSGPGAVAFPATVPAGETASGAFLFTIPTDQRSDVQVEVEYSTQTGLILFTGAAPA